MKISVHLGLLLAGLALAGASLAQGTFPTRPVTLMVPYTAGGQSDVIARVVNNPLARNLGQPVVVENLAGASGSIAANAQTLSDPAVRAGLDAQGLETAKAQTPEEAGKAYAEGAAVFRGIAKAINLQPQ
jgi:tripartite-type tricarboxylate transporter receptor subunit TctC